MVVLQEVERSRSAAVISAGSGGAGVDAGVFCSQVSVSEYEKQKLSGSQLALAELLEDIIHNKNMTEKDKKRRLKQVRLY